MPAGVAAVQLDPGASLRPPAATDVRVSAAGSRSQKQRGHQRGIRTLQSMKNAHLQDLRCLTIHPYIPARVNLTRSQPQRPRLA